MVGLGLLVLHEVFAIRADDFGPDGPRFLPLVVVGLWLGLSVAYLGQQAARVLRHRPGLPAERFAHSLGVAALLGLLVAYAYVLDPLGYLIATFLFFAGSSRALGSRQLRRDVVVAAGLTVVVYFLFTRALGVHLPEGVLPL
jgi:putative tricarboxylic transport membrane protein